MKILFVNPRFPGSLWGFQGITDLVGVRSTQAPLGLLTGTGMTPPEIEVELRDENCYPLNGLQRKVTFDVFGDIINEIGPKIKGGWSL